MLKNLVYSALAIAFIAQTVPAQPINKHGELNWTEKHSWTMEVRPVALAQQLDNKKTYILGEDATIYIYTTSEGRLVGTLPVSPDIVDLAIAPRGETLFLLNGKEKTFKALDITFTRHINIDKAPVLGNADAPVTMIVFSDFECPYCSRVEPLIHQLLEANKNTLKVVFKHLPLPQIHKHAESAARAAIAAQKQGKFWELHDYFFQNKKVQEKDIEHAAKKIGLDMKQFKADWESEETRKYLEDDINDAQLAEVTGTPTLFINGVIVQNRSSDAIQQMIDQAAK